ncbi:MAG: thioesterase family protein [Rickettsiales bacterium]|nr:thioesterase family protein [Rickettsiales bacterium]
MHKFRFQIAYADTDAFGIAYHARHIEICERARVDMMTGWDWNQGGFVLRALSAEYKKPLRVEEIVEVESEFIDVGAASAKVRQTIKVGNEVRSIIIVDAVFINDKMKPIRIPKSLVDFLKNKKG